MEFQHDEHRRGNQHDADTDQRAIESGGQLRSAGDQCLRLGPQFQCDADGDATASAGHCRVQSHLRNCWDQHNHLRNQLQPGGFKQHCLFWRGPSHGNGCKHDKSGGDDAGGDDVCADYGDGGRVDGLLGTAFSPTFIGSGSRINSGSFAPQVTINAPNGQGGVTVADLDGDGKPDLITANTMAPVSPFSATFRPAAPLAPILWPRRSRLPLAVRRTRLRWQIWTETANWI